MKTLLKKLLYNKRSAKKFMSFFVVMHNFSYETISRFSVILNDGIHPKHDIMKYHQFFIDNVTENDAVLDIGCGGGMLAFDLAKKAKKVIGIDICEENILFAKKRFQKENLELVTGDGSSFDFGSKFDVVVLSNVLEHIKDRNSFLDRMHGLTGKLLIRVPMINRDWLAIYKKDNGFEYRLDKTHFIEYTLEDLNRELNQSGWKMDSHLIQFGEIWGISK